MKYQGVLVLTIQAQVVGGEGCQLLGSQILYIYIYTYISIYVDIIGRTRKYLYKERRYHRPQIYFSMILLGTIQAYIRYESNTSISSQGLRYLTMKIFGSQKSRIDMILKP